jgi:hypothetical protein
MRASSLLVLVCLFAAACDTGTSARPEPKPAPAPPPAAAADTNTMKLGAAIDTSAPKIALSEVAKNPDAYVGKTFATTGTVTAVCQHMGCWMEIKDEQGEAHIKMAGHAFFVPKTASGKKARVLATLVKSEEKGCNGAGHAEGQAAGEAKGKGCRDEAEAQLGRPLAKLELEAKGVELL